MAEAISPSVENAAILIMALGEAEAPEVLKHLGPKEVQAIGAAITRLQTVPKNRIDEVLDKFDAEVVAHPSLVPDTSQYVRDVLRAALGEEKARFLLDRILSGSDTSGIESLKWVDPATVADLLRNEHPQIAATVLAHLDSEQAGEVVKLLEERHRNEVLIRLATLDGIHPSALRELNDVMHKVLAGAESHRAQKLGGVKVTADILNFVGNAVEARVLNHVRATDAELARDIEDKMFAFEDLVKVQDKGVQTLLKDVDTPTLVLALKGSAPVVKEKFFSCMSTRAAEALKEELESKGPVRVSEVEAAQKEILKTARRLADEGQISLGEAGGEAYV